MGTTSVVESILYGKIEPGNVLRFEQTVPPDSSSGDCPDMLSWETNPDDAGEQWVLKDLLCRKAFTLRARRVERMMDPERSHIWRRFNRARGGHSADASRHWPDGEVEVIFFDNILVEMIVLQENIAYFYAPVCGQGPHMFLSRAGIRGNVRFSALTRPLARARTRIANAH